MYLKQVALCRGGQNCPRYADVRDATLRLLSHELMTPLGIIEGFSGILEETYTQDKELSTELHYIHEASLRLSRTLQSLVALNQLRSGLYFPQEQTFQLQDLLTFCERTAQDLIAAQQKDITFCLDVQGAPASQTFWGERDKIMVICEALIENAVKFTVQGQVRITVCIKPQGEKMQMCWKIVDTGIGIAEDTKTKIFEPFFQQDMSTTRRHEGCGIGLALVKGLAELMGAVVTVDSCIGQGSTFCINFSLGILPREKILEDAGVRSAQNKVQRSRAG